MSEDMTPHTPATILKIQKHNRAVWLAALRSGRFKQLTGGPVIDRDGRVCAVVGVTKMLLVESGYMTLGDYCFAWTAKGRAAARLWSGGFVCPVQLLGLSWSDFRTLTASNDYGGKSFSEIADMASRMPYVYE